jgi:putative hydrolase of the HAD superfamily
MLKAVFFDAAGTLFDAREPVGHTYARIARQHGLAATDADVSAGFRRAFAGTPGLAFGGPGRRADEIRRLEREWWHGLVRRSFEGLGEFDSFDAFFAELFAYFGDPANWVPLPEAHSVLQRLKDTNLKLGIISNFDYRLYRILDGLEMRPFFDSMSALGVTSDEAIHVGDSEHMDVRGAQDAGLRAILIDTGRNGAAIADGTVARVSSLAEVIEVMRLLRFT